MRRREFITVLGGAAAWPLAARAQQSKIPRIGFLGAATAAGYAKQLEAFRSGLRDLGYVEGKNIVIDLRWAEGKYDRLAALAAELVALNVDVLVTHGTPGTSAAKKVTATIPIVMAVSGDAHMTGLIQGLARTGSNVTGLTYFALEQANKRLELMKDAIPSVSRVAFLENPDNPIMTLEVEAMENPARLLKIVVQPFKVRAPAEFDGAFSMIVKHGFEAVAVGQDGMLTANATKIASIALKQRLASVGEAPFANAGGLIGFGPNYPEMFRRAAYYVDRLLKGAKATDLPVERPVKFELFINLKTARTLGLEIPPMLLARADEVIE